MAVKLKAVQRKDLKSSATKEIRESGRVPAVIYGKTDKAQSISVDSIELVKTVRDEGRNAIISLDIENGTPVDVMLHEYQMHPLKDEIIHADFYAMDLSEEMDVEVPVRLEGEAQGTKDGGILQQPLFELHVRSKPSDIPEEIIVDISELEIGDNISISDLPTAKEYEFLDEADVVVASVLPPEAEEEETSEDDTDVSVEPELIGEDEEDEDDSDA